MIVCISLIFWVFVLGVAVTLCDEHEPFVFRFFRKPKRTREMTKLEKYNEEIVQKYLMNGTLKPDEVHPKEIHPKEIQPQESSKTRTYIEDEDFLDRILVSR